MAFKFINKAGCKSDDGTIIQVTGRFTVEYRENGKIIEIEYEPGKENGKYVALVYTHTFDKYTDGTTVEDKENKIKKFKEAMKFIDFEAIFD